MYEQLKDSHIIKTMVKEHDHILKILDELQSLSRQLSVDDQNNGSVLIRKIHELSNKIISAEPHHQREEKVLFPAMEKKGLSGPTKCMTLEHEVMRKIKHDLKNETINNKQNWKDQIDLISQLISNLCNNLRQHIEKENNVLYPMALKFITEDKEWNEMKIECDEIGYCCFCPTNKKELNKSI